MSHYTDKFIFVETTPNYQKSNSQSPSLPIFLGLTSFRALCQKCGCDFASDYRTLRQSANEINISCPNCPNNESFKLDILELIVNDTK